MTERIWVLLGKKLSNDASSAELEEFVQLLSNNPEAAYEIGYITDWWNIDGVIVRDPAQLYRHLQRLEEAGHTLTALNKNTEPFKTVIKIQREGWFSRKNWMIGIAVVLVAAVSGLIWVQNKPTPESLPSTQVKNEVVTRTGSRYKLALPDGSEVWVNSSSHLTYDRHFGKNNRNVHLNGEAYFMVKKNEDLPFVIHTKRMNVTVTGTTFNVRAYEDEPLSETALIEGRVEIQLAGKPDKTYVLKPNDKLVVSDSLSFQPKRNATKSEQTIPLAIKTSAPIVTLQKLTISNLDSLVAETAWLYSTLAFNDESFKEVALKMEKWYGINIAFQNEPLQKIRFTGRFTTETIQEALEAMQFTARFKFRKVDNNIIIY